MSLMRSGRSCLSALQRNTFQGIFFKQSQSVQRPLCSSQVRFSKQEEAATGGEVEVDGLSRVALVVEGKFKSLKDVPKFMPYGVVAKARDKFRIKVSIASGAALLVLGIFFIRKNQRLRREAEYEGMAAAAAARS